MDAIVLAGGLGTRLRATVPGVPKPMAPVEGRPFLEWLLEYWIAQGVRRFVLSIGHLAGEISGHFGAAWGGAGIAYAVEEEALGTGGGLLLASRETHTEEILVLNGDSFFAIELAELSEFHRRQRADWTLALFRSSELGRYLGFALGEDGRVQSLGGGVLANGGVYLIRTAVLRGFPWKPGAQASLETDLLPHALKEGRRLYGRPFERRFIDIGLPEDYRRAGAFLNPQRKVS